MAVAEAINNKKATELNVHIRRTKISVQQVKEHLLNMKAVYDLVATMPNIENLYSTFWLWEQNYNDDIQGNFAQIVHLLHLCKYRPREKRKLLMVDILMQCSYLGCGAIFPLLSVYKMHILNKPLNYTACGGTIRYETYSLSRFVNATRRYQAHCTLRKKPINIDLLLHHLCQKTENGPHCCHYSAAK
ncbi:hypothetical protein THRCLA_20305 [Thraustotheca clavata]|uniref:Uncharacterized protein n=1 Tax=Thraustotheca clavata TaxID=74557 RepID=A0A1W0A8Z8_9STRA|nr:hypothetical protein THRCLA_20305 [Thraustotheca clavata]